MNNLRIGTSNTTLTSSFNDLVRLNVDFIVVDEELEQKMLDTFGRRETTANAIEILTKLANKLVELLEKEETNDQSNT